jgi:hypothetical protein
MGLLSNFGQMLHFVRGFRLFECTLWLLAPSPFLPFLGWLGPAAVPASSTRTTLDTLVSSPLHLTSLKKRSVWLPSWVIRGLSDGMSRVSHC